MCEDREENTDVPSHTCVFAYVCCCLLECEGGLLLKWGGVGQQSSSVQASALQEIIRCREDHHSRLAGFKEIILDMYKAQYSRSETKAFVMMTSLVNLCVVWESFAQQLVSAIAVEVSQQVQTSVYDSTPPCPPHWCNGGEIALTMPPPLFGCNSRTHRHDCCCCL